MNIESGAFKTDDGRILETGDLEELMLGSYYKHNNHFPGHAALFGFFHHFRSKPHEPFPHSAKDHCVPQ